MASMVLGENSTAIKDQRACSVLTPVVLVPYVLLQNLSQLISLILELGLVRLPGLTIYLC